MSKKGITPIIATVLLLMITVAVAGGVSVFLTSVQQRSQSDIEESTALITSQTQQAISVSFVRCVSGASGNVTVVIRNSGTKRINEGDVELTISSEDGRTNLAYKAEPSTWTSLDPDNTDTMTWQLSTMAPTISMVNDDTYQLTITVPGGAKTQKACTATP